MLEGCQTWKRKPMPAKKLRNVDYEANSQKQGLIVDSYLGNS